jgi:alkylation response protein AidB-like acyl-CoA dehydrogenase
LLPKLAGGTLKVVLAHAEGNRGVDLVGTRTVAKAVEDGYALTGRKLNVPDAGSADLFIVCARTSGGQDDEDGLSLFLVNRSTSNLGVVCRTGFDGGEIGELHLDDVVVVSDALLGARDAGFQPMQHAVHRGIAALLAEAVGAMERLVEISIAYLKTRRQFGQPLAGFQALQHHIADMATSVEQAHSMSLLATAAITGSEAAERARSVAAAKYLVGRHALQIGKCAVQLHGGIGMTEELAVGHYFRRLMTINAAWGNAEQHLGYFANGLS